MNVLFVSKISPVARSVFPIFKYVEIGQQLGYHVALYGEQTNDTPRLPYSLDAKAFDAVIFVVYEPWDFPDMPYLAQLLDTVPKERRIIIDCCGRYNDTIRIEHDFNHLEKMDKHQGWEWIEGFEAVAGTILQPTLKPLRSNVRSFLWHAFDPASIAKPYSKPDEAAVAWADRNGGGKPFGMTYVGHNWQRWTQLKKLLEGVQPLSADFGPVVLAGADWERRPDWAEQLGIQGVDVSTELMARVRAEAKPPIPFQEMIGYMSQGRFSPVIHRPLFNELGFVTNRTFATFCADTIPVLMLPHGLVEAIYGPSALPLCVPEDVTGYFSAILRNPASHWKAVLDTRKHLAEHHTFQRRFQELTRIIEDNI
jgi:hypothetical protein